MEECWMRMPVIIVLLTWQLPFNKPLRLTTSETYNIPRYLGRGNIFNIGALFLGTMPPQFNRLKIYASWQTVEFHCPCLPLSAVWQTWHSVSPNNEYCLTKMAFYCMWCHPALEFAWALYGCDKSGHVQKKRVKQDSQDEVPQVCVCVRTSAEKHAVSLGQIEPQVNVKTRCMSVFNERLKGLVLSQTCFKAAAFIFLRGFD